MYLPSKDMKREEVQDVFERLVKSREDVARKQTLSGSPDPELERFFRTAEDAFNELSDEPGEEELDRLADLLLDDLTQYVQEPRIESEMVGILEGFVQFSKEVEQRVGGSTKLGVHADSLESVVMEYKDSLDKELVANADEVRDDSEGENERVDETYKEGEVVDEMSLQGERTPNKTVCSSHSMLGLIGWSVVLSFYAYGMTIALQFLEDFRLVAGFVSLVAAGGSLLYVFGQLIQELTLRAKERSQRTKRIVQAVFTLVVIASAAYGVSTVLSNVDTILSVLYRVKDGFVALIP
jgi:hypothetical protein